MNPFFLFFSNENISLVFKLRWVSSIFSEDERPAKYADQQFTGRSYSGRVANLFLIMLLKSKITFYLDCTIIIGDPRGKPRGIS
jgi:hypothetical protein